MAVTDPALFATADSPVVVVGGSLAGMAVAARLAYRGHHVVLVERTAHLGGHYRETGLSPVIDLPAVWRDLFTKSGRALDPVLAMRDVQWQAVAASRHRFADGTELDWPTNQGEQTQLITELWGLETAGRWATLLDHWRTTWQTLRPLGVETDTTPAARRVARDELSPAGFGKNTTLADLGDFLHEPHLAALVRQVAWQHGQDPVRLPAHHGFRLATARIFGRWTLTTPDGAPPPGNLLLELLHERLGQRGVEVRTGTPVHRVADRTVYTEDGSLDARAVICAVSPQRWMALTRPGRWRRSDQVMRRLARQPSANAPIITTVDYGTGMETVDHQHHTMTWPVAGAQWSWTAPRPAASAGPAWTSLATWNVLPGPRIPPHYVVGAHTRAGFGSTGELFSAALAAYAVHGDLTGEDIHPSNRDQPPRLRPRRRQ